MYAALAALTDLVHALSMVLWALGLPLLFWHARPRLTLIYSWYALGFVVASQLSHLVLGECFFTTLSRELWEAAGDPTMGSFTSRLVNLIAGFRPTEREVVMGWELAIVGTSIALLWSMYRRHRRRRSQDQATHPV